MRYYYCISVLFVCQFNYYSYPFFSPMLCSTVIISLLKSSLCISSSENKLKFVFDNGWEGYLGSCEALPDVEIIIIGFILFSSA